MRYSALGLILFLSCNYTMLSQTLMGKVYDATSTVKGVKVFNKTQNSLTATNEDGDFSIPARVGDTLAFESLFHHPKVEILESFHFEKTAVFELKTIINTLDEVEIKSEPEQPVFEEDTYNIELQTLIQEDIKRNPGLYMPQGSQYGVDFIYLIGQVAKLFTGKRSKIPTFRPMTYRQLDSLFENSSFFNKRLLDESLQIPQDKRQLFLDFYAAKQPSSELLKDGKKMELLEDLVLNSQLFLMLLEQYGKESISKD
ncbi:peptidase associated/transthyretin-like domain-containing protein [Winogradskyella aurantia]|nr:hypothetical protein [Winogradskyella aurantia]